MTAPPSATKLDHRVVLAAHARAGIAAIEARHLGSAGGEATDRYFRELETAIVLEFPEEKRDWDLLGPVYLFRYQLLLAEKFSYRQSVVLAVKLLLSIVDRLRTEKRWLTWDEFELFERLVDRLEEFAKAEVHQGERR